MIKKKENVVGSSYNIMDSHLNMSLSQANMEKKSVELFTRLEVLIGL